MRPRHVAVGFAAAALLAATGFVPAAASGSAGSSTICVGLVLDARSIGGSVSDGCVNVEPGSTGVDVLQAGGHRVTFRQDGLLCTIDGLPKTGCSAVDNSHYWAYYHRAPGSTSWSYSDEGAAQYEPANRSTEGWVYDDGTSLKPENIPAAKICAALVGPTATPSSKPTNAASPKHSATKTAAASPAATAPESRHSRGARRADRAGPSGAKTASTAGLPSPSPSAPRSGAAVAPGSGRLGGAGRAGSTGGAGGGGSAAGAIIAAAVIAVLVAATVIGARRRRH